MTAMTRKKIHFYNHAPFTACDVCVGRCKRQHKLAVERMQFFQPISSIPSPSTAHFSVVSLRNSTGVIIL